MDVQQAKQTAGIQKLLINDPGSQRNHTYTKLTQKPGVHLLLYQQDNQQTGNQWAHHWCLHAQKPTSEWVDFTLPLPPQIRGIWTWCTSLPANILCIQVTMLRGLRLAPSQGRLHQVSHGQGT